MNNNLMSEESVTGTIDSVVKDKYMIIGKPKMSFDCYSYALNRALDDLKGNDSEFKPENDFEFSPEDFGLYAIVTYSVNGQSKNTPKIGFTPILRNRELCLRARNQYMNSVDSFVNHFSGERFGFSVMLSESQIIDVQDHSVEIIGAADILLKALGYATDNEKIIIPLKE